LFLLHRGFLCFAGYVVYRPPLLSDHFQVLITTLEYAFRFAFRWSTLACATFSVVLLNRPGAIFGGGCFRGANKLSEDQSGLLMGMVRSSASWGAVLHPRSLFVITN
jgi:hypothetical protein